MAGRIRRSTDQELCSFFGIVGTFSHEQPRWIFNFFLSSVCSILSPILVGHFLWFHGCSYCWYRLVVHNGSWQDYVETKLARYHLQRGEAVEKTLAKGYLSGGGGGILFWYVICTDLLTCYSPNPIVFPSSAPYQGLGAPFSISMFRLVFIHFPVRP